MCGILAILLSGKSPSELRDICIKQRKLLVHRGPDWSGLYMTEFEKAKLMCALVHERLAIVGVGSGLSRSVSSVLSL